MTNFTYLQNLSVHDHTYLDFADVHIGRDNRLFIDPARIHVAALDGDFWAKKADALINSFFTHLCLAASAHDYSAVQNLIRNTCGERNETQLGWSRGYPAGTGASLELIWPAIKQLISRRYFDEGLVSGLEDIPIWASGIDADRLSDWVTNIIWPVLHEFTTYQYNKYHLPHANEAVIDVSIWDSNLGLWRPVTFPRLLCNGETILLCPKKFLHTHLLMSAADFLQKIVLEWRQREHLDQRSGLCHTHTDQDGNQEWRSPTKKELVDFEVRGNSRSDYIYRQTLNNPDMIRAYHRRYEVRPGDSSKFISDEELNRLLYA